jgi:GAF domain-containing protein/PAS domain-containing protein
MSIQQEDEIGEKRVNALVVAPSQEPLVGAILASSNRWNCDFSTDIVASLYKIVDGRYDAMVIEKSLIREAYERSQYSKERSILENLPAGLVLVDLDQQVIWGNRMFCKWAFSTDPVGQKFFDLLSRPEMRGPDYSPFSKVRRTGTSASTLLFIKESNLFLSMDVGPFFGPDGKVSYYIVDLHDVTVRLIRANKWTQLREAGKGLADLSRKDVLSRSPKERTNILRAKIGKYAQEILNFASIEVRTISAREPNLLEPLFALGMAEVARQRKLYVSQDGNGITGWVAYHGKSYKMDDSREDPFFIEGVPGARSSLTVPLICRGVVIGTFNVESQQPNAFDDNDLKLLESFAADVALAVHTLELLSVEQRDTAFRSIEKVFSDAVAPLNLILNETARFPFDNLQDHPDTENCREITEAFIRIREATREIQSVFQGSIATIAPDLPLELSSTDCNNYPMLRDKRILLVDADKSVGTELGKLLFYYGCTVEASTTGFGAIKMLEMTEYDAFMSDIKLPDMSAFKFYKEVRCIYCKRHNHRPLNAICEPPEEDPCCPSPEVPFIPFIYMRSFGYDSGHVTVRAAQAGVPKPIFKPFILTQLLDTLKLVITKAEHEKQQKDAAARQ